MAYEIILRGRVQGVCCRHYCSQVGKALGISGAATNLVNGDVRVLLETVDREIVEKYALVLKNNQLGYRFYGMITSYKIEKWDGKITGDYTW